MSSVNKVILVGNLGAKPEIRTMQSGDKMAQLSIATSERWTDKNSGEKREKTEWHRVVVFNKGLVNVIERYLDKGSKVYIEGQLETRKWQDQNGADKYTTEVVLRPFRGELTMLDSRSSGSGGGDFGGGYNDNRGYDNGPSDNGFSQQATGTTGAPPMDDFDDEIPF